MKFDLSPSDVVTPLMQDALKNLWRLAYPERELPSLKSELWKDMGWQGSDPSTDFRWMFSRLKSIETICMSCLLAHILVTHFRGGGFISLENLIFFAMTYPVSNA